MNLMNLSMNSEEELNNTFEVKEDCSVDKTLEVYKTAERFKSLSLLSGSAFSKDDLKKCILDRYGKEGLQRLALVRFVLKTLNLVPSNDVLLNLSCTKSSKVIIATAGSGKTTSLQIDLLVSKLLDKITGKDEIKPMLIEGTSVSVPRIVYLNYNRHNVKPIEDRHKQLCDAINGVIKEEESIDNSIDSSTVHAFCHRWLNAFSSKLDIPELKIISDDDKEKVWSAIIKPRWKKFYDEEENEVESSKLDELYVYKTESILEWDEFFQTAKFVDSGLMPDFVKSCIKKYDSMKKQMRLLDFTDYLLLFLDVMKTHPELREQLQKRYKIIVADENQDFTKLMNEILLQLYNPKLNKLIVVGDPDQTIYAFKGVSVDNMVSLSESLEDVELLGLDTNYRCPKNIVDGAKSILDLNTMRFEKPINTIKTGGRIVSHPLKMQDSQEDEVVKFLEGLNQNEWCNTVITYRNNISSTAIAEELYYAGIPFVMLDGRRPFTNIVFQQILRGLRALYEKDDVNLNLGLYRFLPLSKEKWTEIVEFNRLRRRNHLHDYDIPYDLPSGCLDALKVLISISELITENPVCDYITAFLKLYRKYYFDFIIRTESFGSENFLMYYERAVRFFNRQMSLKFMLEELKSKNIDNPAGVSLSTFHGLKGLEFNYVLALDFDESVFPNYFSIEQRYPINTAMQEKESENRLCYVLVTRAIKELHLFFSENDPSAYVNVLMNNSKQDEENKPDNIALNVITDPSKTNSKLNFVQRLLNGRG